MSEWTLIGTIDNLKQKELQEITVGQKKIALSYVDGKFSALNNKCNHMGGPLGQGKLKGKHIECPWHYWQFHHETGEALVSSTEPLAYKGGCVPHFPLKIENGSLFIDLGSESKRESAEYNHNNPAMKVAREVKREAGKIRVLGISTTNMDKHHPRYSTSEELLNSALLKAQNELNVETKTLNLWQMNFRACEGFYSKSAKACTWPCSISKLDEKDEMIQIYENMVHWADVVIVATPIRWGSASSLYYKMVERLNSIQNQITVKNNILIKNKVAGFIITGGQDNIQAVAGQMMNFFGELGFMTPSFPYIAHSLGWSAEEMEKNMDYVKNSADLHEASFGLVKRSIELSGLLLQHP